MTDLRFTPGQAVDVRRATRGGSWRVAAYRYKNMSKWMSSVIAFGLGNPILNLIAFGIGIGALVDKNTGGHGIAGVSYLQFVAPALLASAAIQGIVDEVTGPVLDGFVWDEYFFAQAATSLNHKQMINGIMIIASGRGLFTSILYGGVLTAFGAIPLASLLPLILVGVGSSTAWAALVFSWTSRLTDANSVFDILHRFVFMPMFLFSGTFYPLSSSPIYLQWIGWISPLWHATELGRYLTIGEQIPLWLLIVHVAYFVVMFVVGMALTYPVFKRRLFS
jgi:lipooligosaccharide transport system permease protein